MSQFSIGLVISLGKEVFGFLGRTLAKAFSVEIKIFGFLSLQQQEIPELERKMVGIITL